MKHLYVCRHGESQLNVQETYSGRLDTSLTDRGREQARQAGAGATDLHIDLIVASTLDRAAETARIIAGQIGYPAADIISNALVIERSFGSLEGKPWTTPADVHVFPDMETDEALVARAREALDYLRSLPAENILLVSHGSFLVALRTLIDPHAATEELHNAEVTRFI